MTQYDKIPLMTVERFFRPGECFHMQISTDFPDYMGILHRHEYIEVVYVLSGSAIHTVNDKCSTVKRGDLCIVNVDTVHMFCPERKSAEPLIVYDLMFTPAFFDETLGATLEALTDSYLFRSLSCKEQAGFGVSESLNARFSELFNRMYDEYRGCAAGSMEIIRAYLLQILVTAMRMNAEEGKSTERSKERLTRLIIDRIDADYASAIGVKELAQSVHISPDYLGRVFKEVTGQAVGTYIRTVRIRNACRLLSSTQRTVADIAAACGFADTKNFYSAFKKHTGLLPGDYRKRNADGAI